MWIKRWRERVDERGQGLMEYAVILGFVAVLCVAALSGLGQQIVTVLYDSVVGAFP